METCEWKKEQANWENSTYTAHEKKIMAVSIKDTKIMSTYIKAFVTFECIASE